MRNQLLVRRLLAWFARSARDLPWRRTRSPYAIWVSEIMLQQTQVKTVLPYWERWMQALPDIGAVGRASPERLHKLWEGLGYYTRVRNLRQAARLIQANHGGRFPEDFDQVLALPGIGRSTAGAICSIAFNQPRPVLDGNVMRVLSRLFGIDGDPRKKAANAKLWRLAQGLTDHALRVAAAGSWFGTPASAGSTGTDGASRVAAAGSPSGTPASAGSLAADQALRVAGSGSCSELSQSLIELGALICTPRQPRCGLCPVSGGCVARRQGRVHELPQTARRPQTTPRRFAAFVIRKRGRFLVRQRPAGEVNAHLWEFPNVELAPGNAGLQRAAQDVLGIQPVSIKPLCAIRHSITRYRITLEAFLVEGQGSPGSDVPIRGRWLNHRQLAPLPFAGAHRKILHQLARLPA
jgi:A/G-specific adenine glycosylase